MNKKKIFLHYLDNAIANNQTVKVYFAKAYTDDWEKIYSGENLENFKFEVISKYDFDLVEIYKELPTRIYDYETI